MVTEPALEERRQHLCQRLLNHPIQHRRHAQRTLRPVGLRDEHPAHRRRAVRPLHERGAYPWPVLPAERRKRLDGHPVDARSPRVGLDSSPSRPQVLRRQDLLHHGLLLNAPMLPVVAALTASSPSGVIGCDVLHAVGTFLFGSALHDIESSGFVVYTGVFQPPARCSLLWPLLTPRRVAPSGSPQVRTRCFPARPPHLPPRLNHAASLCCATSPHRVGLYAVLVRRPAGFR